MGNTCLVTHAHESIDFFEDGSDKVKSAMGKNRKKPIMRVSMLLLGPAESGKSTLFKQLRVSGAFIVKIFYQNHKI